MKNHLQKFGIISMIFMGISVSSYSQKGTVTVDQDKDIAKLLEYKKDLKTIDFFKIQIFSSSNRSEADQVKNSFSSSFGQWPVEVIYDTPNFKAQVGNFRTRLEADRAMQQIKSKYSNAFIFKSKKK
ncbi:Sporulation related domain-containing protein [Flavobacteriaceae bacterium MAR_2010_188]|nr:Sporulation related domain-containing protein [Flavobacteriaceae bacterium MAR_2010_188]